MGRGGARETRWRSRDLLPATTAGSSSVPASGSNVERIGKQEFAEPEDEEESDAPVDESVFPVWRFSSHHAYLIIQVRTML